MEMVWALFRINPTITPGEVQRAWVALPNRPACGPESAGSYLEVGLRQAVCVGARVMSPSNLARMTDQPIFLSGPHELDRPDFTAATFGHYNPEFVRWAADNLIPTNPDGVYARALRAAYETHLRPAAVYYGVERRMASDPARVAQLADVYQSAIDRARARGPEAASEVWDQISVELEPFAAGYEGMDGLHAITAAGFWLRRHMDGSRPAFRDGLVKLLAQVDPDVLER